MDKFEYQIRLAEMNKLVVAQDDVGAAKIADSIDWRRVKSVRTLIAVSEIYEVNNRFEDARDVLVLAYSHAQIGRQILYRLVEVSIKLKEFDEAVDFYTEFVQLSPSDNSRYILKYKIYKGRGSSLEEQIKILEDYKKLEYTEKYSYELAKLYSKADKIDKSIQECDDIALWFRDGKYVNKAMELKMKYAPLTKSQREIYDNRHDLVEEEVIEEALKNEREQANRGDQELKIAQDNEKKEKKKIEKETPVLTDQDIVADMVMAETEKAIAASLAKEFVDLSKGKSKKGKKAKDRSNIEKDEMNEKSSMESKDNEDIEELKDNFDIGKEDLKEDTHDELERNLKNYLNNMAKGNVTDLAKEEPTDTTKDSQESDNNDEFGKTIQIPSEDVKKELNKRRANLLEDEQEIKEELKEEPKEESKEEIKKKPVEETEDDFQERLARSMRAIFSSVSPKDPFAQSEEEGQEESPEDEQIEGQLSLEEFLGGDLSLAKEDEDSKNENKNLKELLNYQFDLDDELQALALEKEEEARKVAEEKARLEAEEKARLEAEEKARLEAEEKARLEAEEKARLEAEEKARLEAEEKARLEAEEKAKLEAEEKARLEAEEKARLEAEEKARLEAEEKARLEAEEKARLEAEEKARLEVEEKARLEAEEKANLEAEEKARLEAEEKEKQAAEEKARQEKEEETNLDLDHSSNAQENGQATIEPEFDLSSALEAAISDYLPQNSNNEETDNQEDISDDSKEWLDEEDTIDLDENDEIEEVAATKEVEIEEPEIEETEIHTKETNDLNAEEVLDKQELEEKPFAELTDDEIIERISRSLAETSIYAKDQESSESEDEELIESGDEELIESENEELIESEDKEVLKIKEDLEDLEEAELSTEEDLSNTEENQELDHVLKEETDREPLGQIEETLEAALQNLLKDTDIPQKEEPKEELTDEEDIYLDDVVTSEDHDDTEEPEIVTEEIVVSEEEIISKEKQDSATLEEVSDLEEIEEDSLEESISEEDLDLTEEQKGMFSYFAPVQGMTKQLARNLASMRKHDLKDKTSRTGNIVVLGEHGTGKTVLALRFLEAVGKERGIDKIKIKTIDASDLNNGNVAALVGKMKEDALVIQRGGMLNDNAADELSQAMGFKTGGLIVLIEDEKVRMRKLLADHRELEKKFTCTINIPIFTNDELVSFGKSYAKELDYRIDDMGILALYNEIGESQSEKEPVTVAVVKGMVDAAIKRANRFGFTKFGRILLNRRYDKEDRIILYEKDFR